jgi:hypothetical protein
VAHDHRQEGVGADAAAAIDARRRGVTMFGWLRGLFAPRAPRQSREYRLLLKLVFDDTAAAERLIAFEQKREPGLSRDQAIHKALDRLEYERTR